MLTVICPFTSGVRLFRLAVLFVLYLASRIDICVVDEYWAVAINPSFWLPINSMLYRLAGFNPPTRSVFVVPLSASPLSSTASGATPLLLPVICPSTVVPVQAFTVIRENVVTTPDSSVRLLVIFPAALFPSQLFHGVGAILPTAPRFMNTDRVLASATSIETFAVVDEPLLSVAIMVRL